MIEPQQPLMENQQQNQNNPDQQQQQQQQQTTQDDIQSNNNNQNNFGDVSQEQIIQQVHKQFEESLPLNNARFKKNAGLNTMDLSIFDEFKQIDRLLVNTFLEDRDFKCFGKCCPRQKWLHMVFRDKQGKEIARFKELVFEQKDMSCLDCLIMCFCFPCLVCAALCHFNCKQCNTRDDFWHFRQQKRVLRGHVFQQKSEIFLTLSIERKGQGKLYIDGLLQGLSEQVLTTNTNYCFPNSVCPDATIQGHSVEEQENFQRIYTTENCASCLASHCCLNCCCGLFHGQCISQNLTVQNDINIPIESIGDMVTHTVNNGSRKMETCSNIWKTLEVDISMVDYTKRHLLILNIAHIQYQSIFSQIFFPYDNGDQMK